jgi:CheY-like chemotaxis protein
MRVLIVDDVPANRLVAAGILKKRGHNVMAVANGREALARLEQEDFDVVLMDLLMPVMGGVEATRIIRDPASLVRRHDVPVIAVTAFAEGDGKRDCMEAGMNGYLSLPLRRDALIQTVEQYDAGA